MRRLAVVWGVVGGLAACGGAPVVAEAPPGQRVVAFANTTEQCLAPEPLEVRLVDGTLLASVAPGASVRLTVPDTTDRVLAVAGSAEHAVALPKGAAEVYHGCADPRFARPFAGGVPYDLVQHVHGCGDGPFGPTRWRLVDGACPDCTVHAVAGLAPGTSARRWLPPGDYTLAIDGPTREGLRALTVTPGQAGRVAVGCAAADRPPGLRPITVRALAERCERPSPVTVRVGARAIVIREPGDGYTISLPTGRHDLRFVRPGPDAVDEIVPVELGEAGVVVERSPCRPASDAAEGR